jgi:thiol-disulfide isomerase/thioredoxin
MSPFRPFPPASALATLTLASLVSLTFVACGGGATPDAKAPSNPDESGASTSHPALNQTAPDLSIRSLNNRGTLALDRMSGKIVVVDFWATWCEPCKQSFPVLEQLSKRHPGKVEVVGVSVNDEVDGVAKFAEDLHTTFAIGWDDGHAIAKRWNVQTMPTSFVIDASGTVRHVHAGFHDDTDKKIAEEVDSLLEKGSSAPTPKAAKESKDSKDDAPKDQAAAASDAPASSPEPSAAPASDPPPATAKPTNKKKKKKKKTTAAH